MQFLKVNEECSNFFILMSKVKSFLNQYNYEYSIIVPPHVNEQDSLPPYYNIPCYLKKRKDNFAIYVDLYVEDVSPVNALIILTDDLLTAELITQKLSLYLLN